MKHRVLKAIINIMVLRHIALLTEIISLAGLPAGFGYSPHDYGYGTKGENYFLLLLGICCLLWITVNILLLYGAITKQHKFLLPWICWHLVFPVIALTELIWSSIVMRKTTSFKSIQYDSLRASTAFVLCIVVPFLCTVVYFTVVVYSLYCDLKEAERNNAANTPGAPPINTLRQVDQNDAATAPPYDEFYVQNDNCNFVPPRQTNRYEEVPEPSTNR